jgi:hypothetical protein
MIRRGRLKRNRDIWLASFFVVGVLVATLSWIVSAGGPAFASGPALISVCSTDATGSGTVECAPSPAPTTSELVLVVCATSSASSESVPGVYSGTASIYNLQIQGVGTGLLGMEMDDEYGGSGFELDCSETSGSYTYIEVSVWSGLTVSEIDQTQAYTCGPSGCPAATFQDYGYGASGYSELTMTSWVLFGTSSPDVSSCGYGLTLAGAVQNSSQGDTMGLCYGATSGSSTSNTSEIFTSSNSNDASALEVDFGITLSGTPPGTPSSSTTSTTGATTTTACHVVNNEDYCSGVSPTTIDGESCAWDVGDQAYVCPNGSSFPGTTTTTSVPPTTTTLPFCFDGSATTSSGTTTTVPCTVTGETTTGGTSCDWWDPVCWIEALLEPSPASLTAFNTELATSGANSLGTSMATLATNTYDLITSGGAVAYDGCEYDYDGCNAGTGPAPSTYYGGGSEGTGAGDGCVFGGSTPHVSGEVLSGLGSVSGLICFFVSSATSNSEVDSWLGVINGLVTAGVVIATVLAAFRIIFGMFASGK